MHGENFTFHYQAENDNFCIMLEKLFISSRTTTRINREYKKYSDILATTTKTEALISPSPVSSVASSAHTNVPTQWDFS